MKLILARHGETIENKKGIIQGQIQGRLSKLGKIQAKKLGKKLKTEKLDIIYSSDLKRCVDTAKEITKYHPNIPIIFAKELREQYLGKMQGKKRPELPWKIKENNAETLQQLRKRAKLFLEKIMKKHGNENVLFLSHGGIGKVIVSIIKKTPMTKFPKEGHLHNASISVFELNENKKHKVRLFNYTKYLN